MSARWVFASLVTALALPTAARAQPAQAGDAPENAPLLRLETDGPTSLVTALAFRPETRQRAEG